VPETPNLGTYLRPLRQRAWLIALVAIVAAGATYLYYESRPKDYVATTTLLAQMSPLERNLLGDPGIQVDANQVAVLIESTQVRDAVARELGGMPGSVDAEVLQNPTGGTPNVVSVTATASTAEDAARLANTYARTFSSLTASQDRQEVTDARLRAEEELRDLQAANADRVRQRDLREQIERLSGIEQLPAVGSRQIDRAVAPSAPIGESPERSAIFAFVLGLGLAAVAAYLWALLDSRVSSAEELERIYGLPLLGLIPRDRNLSSGSSLTLDPPLREALRTVRVRLQLQARNRELRTIAVTSAVHGEGRSSIVRSLALEYRAAGQRAAVIDADVTDPRLAELFLVGAEPGLTDVIVGERPVEEVLQPVGASEGASGSQRAGNGTPAQALGSIAVLSRGSEPERWSPRVSSEKLKPVLDELASSHDVVLIDSPPLLPLSDAVEMLSAVDGVLVVGGLGRLTREAATEARSVLDQLTDAEVAGVLSNDVPRRRSRLWR
jgi:succinoglycan biosynthesis transport protein ExoP